VELGITWQDDRHPVVTGFHDVVRVCRQTTALQYGFTRKKSVW
jgi:hypothetical protein